MKRDFTVQELHIHINFGNEVTFLLRKIMSTQAELAAKLDVVTAQITKIGTETTLLLANIATLTAALEASGATTPEVDSALEALQAQASIVDDLVPDSA